MKKLSLIGGIILAVLIVTAVNFYPQKVDQHKGEQFRGRMLEKLNLTDEQKDKIQQLGIENQKKMIDLRADMEKKHLAMKELTQSGNYSRSDFLNIVKEISLARDQIANAKANHRMDVYELLNDEQKKIFNEMPMMRGPQGEGRCMMRDGRKMMHKGGMMNGKPPMDDQQNNQ